jgi:hypothetical protein
MCKFKSGIITYKHGRVLHDDFIDQHSDILNANNIEDNHLKAKFVRVEIVPKDNNICNQDKTNWELIIDQDHIPDWFDKEKAYNQMWRALLSTWNKVFIINETLGSIKDKKIRVMFNSKIKMLDNSTVNEMLDNSTVNEMWGNSTVNAMLDNSTVNEMWGNSTVNEMWGNSTVNEMWGNSTVNEMWGNSTVNAMRGNSTVNAMRGNSTVNAMWDNSTVNAMWDNSTVNAMWGNSLARVHRNEVNIKIIKDNSITINYTNQNPVINTTNNKVKVKIVKNIKKK